VPGEQLADGLGIAPVPLGKLAPRAFLCLVIVGDGEGHDVLQGHFTIAVSGEQGGADIRQLEPFLHDGFGHAEAGGNIGRRHALVDECPKRLEFVGRVHRFALDVLGKADFRCVGIVVEDVAGDERLRLHAAGFYERFERPKPAAPCDHGVFAALVLADDEGLQKAVRVDGCGQFVDALVGIGLADIAFPSEKLVEGDADRVGHNTPLWFE